MTTEQKEAIEYLKEHINYFKEQIKFIEAVDSDYYNEEYEIYKNRAKQFETVLNLIQEQEKEIDCLKNHVHYKICKNCGEEFRAKRSDARFCKKCAITVNNKEWYKNLTDEQKAKRREQSKSSMRKIRERRKYDS